MGISAGSPGNRWFKHIKTFLQANFEPHLIYIIEWNWGNWRTFVPGQNMLRLSQHTSKFETMAWGASMGTFQV